MTYYAAVQTDAPILQCQHCEVLFSVLTIKVIDDDIYYSDMQVAANIYCPFCGKKNEGYLTLGSKETGRPYWKNISDDIIEERRELWKKMANE